MTCAPFATASSASADTASMFGRTGPGRGSCNAAMVRLRVMAALCRKLLARAMEAAARPEEHTSELQSLMRISYAVFGLKKNKHNDTNNSTCSFTDFHTIIL